MAALVVVKPFRICPKRPLKKQPEQVEYNYTIQISQKKNNSKRLSEILKKSYNKDRNMNNHIKTNRDHWNKLTEIHKGSDFYNVDTFKKGENTIPKLEIDEIGSVKGKSLLHLQCHFGMDTLSWARLGAITTGADLSDSSIAYAKELSRDLNIPASFICSDIYNLPKVLSEKFDVIYTSGGVLCWLSDLPKWGQLISNYLKQGGMFYIREEHPFANMYSHEFQLKTDYYFDTGEPEHVIPKGSYANRKAIVTTTSYQWHHTIEEIIDSLIFSGLKIDFFHEFPFIGYARFGELMEQDKDGWFRFKDRKVKIPLTFSLKATKY
ncbi:SAM-dependent methyltransferase [candidate division WWE3 bacterium CG10_big_fil_rev_8_21_14_0_10_39_14]|nr:MAG: SAM-dependent methyltransferase [candidate division WWE3 bacterium CG10_big_fil_rev_8_21_14_0_10_39_14]